MNYNCLECSKELDRIQYSIGYGFCLECIEKDE